MIEGDRLNCSHGNVGPEVEAQEEGEDEFPGSASLSRKENDDRNCCRSSAIGWNRDLYSPMNDQGSDEHCWERGLPGVDKGVEEEGVEEEGKVVEVACADEEGG